MCSDKDNKCKSDEGIALNDGEDINEPWSVGETVHPGER